MIYTTLKRSFIVAVFISIFTTPILGQQSAASVCNDVAKKANTSLWDGMREAGDELFCRKPWVERDKLEWAGCALHVKTNKMTNKLKNTWNRYFDNAGADWATMGARAIGPDWESGKISVGFKRTFFGAGLDYHDNTVEVVKETGRAEATITVCELDYDGNVVSSHRRSFPSGKGNENTSRSVTIESNDMSVIGIVIDTKAGVNTFEYRAKLTNDPKRNNLGPVSGIADLHVHQLANITFGGRMMWGHYDGPLETALAPEIITGAVQNPEEILPGIAQGDLEQRIIAEGLDANIIVAAAGGKEADEGFFQLRGDGHPGYADWPHHADRTHQQTHMEWIEEAHTRGKAKGSNLNLMIASLVNNNTLCSVMKTFDPRGNVSDGSGGWESANWGCPDHENVLRQLKALHELENKYDWFQIAVSPWHARQIISEGGLAVIVALETDKPLSGPGGNYGNFLDQLDEYRAMGVTSMQIVHESDSEFCGAAPHRTMMQALQLINWPIKSFNNLKETGSTFNLDSNGFNSLGLTPKGRELVDGMVQRNMPIDLAHGSHNCRSQVIDRVPKGYGLYDSHTKFEALMDPNGDVMKREKKFMVTNRIIGKYLEADVLLGLRTASIDVEDAPGAAVANTCPGSARSFAQLVQFATDQGFDIAYGTDFNTGVSQLGPRFGLDRCYAYKVSQLEHNLDKNKHQTRPASQREPRDQNAQKRRRNVGEIAGTNYYTHGLATIGWLPELTIDLVDNLRTPGADRLRRSAEAYIKMWERSYDHDDAGNTTASSGIDPGSLIIGATCNKDDQCQTGKCSGALGAQGSCVCNDDGDCGSGQFCNGGIDLQLNVCENLKPDDASCAVAGGGHQCESGLCRGGRCYTPNSKQMGESCWVGASCAVGKCNNVADGTRGTCVCEADGDCGSNQYCDAGVDLTANQCKTLKADNATCAVVGGNHQCESGVCSTYGRCYTPDSVPMGGLCYTDKACDGGKCSSADGFAGTCVCKSDSDCSSNQWCDNGLDATVNSCKAKLPNGAICGKVGDIGVGKRCLSGKCKVSGLSTNLKCKS